MTVALLVTAVVVLAALYASRLATRIDRLHARTDGARAALDAALVRRSAGAGTLAEDAARRGLVPAHSAAAVTTAAELAREAPMERREAAENDLAACLFALLGGPDGPAPRWTATLRADERGAAELTSFAAAASRVRIARSFYNEAVRDTRIVRRRRVVRLLRLAGHAPLPLFFDVDDRLPAAASQVANLSAPLEPVEPVQRSTGPGTART